MRLHLLLSIAMIACVGDKVPDDSASPPAADTTPAETGDDTPDDTEAAEGDRTIAVTVTLDGEPIEGAVVIQGGGDETWTTDAAGQVTVTTDSTIEGEQVLMASHPEARIAGDYLPADDAMAIALERFDQSDNPDYSFQDPGEPERRNSTAQCAHCHIDFVDDWYDSAHRYAASGPAVQDLYAGASAALSDQAGCEEAGGSWLIGALPGGGDGERCYLGEGVLGALNGCEAPCDAPAKGAYGACADCHAPGIDGALGGRDLLEATGHAYDYGVHCDVCHKVESVDLTQRAGVAGALRIIRPTEDSPSISLGEFKPLTFGVYYDVLNPRMGSVRREHLKEADFCGGCHQLDQAVLVPGATIDLDRWPEGTLPVHSTWAEWDAGPMNPAAPCQSCHMPPLATGGNSADLGVYTEALLIGIASGWWREPGSVRHHTWTGPRTPEGALEGLGVLELAAALEVEAAVQGDALAVSVTSKNVGPGHAIPTGEPLRSILLLVEAECDGAPLAATGGAVVPDYGGHLERREAGEPWLIWPDAEPGQVLRVVARTGAWVDYEGFGPFGDGTFDAAAKGLPEEVFAGEVEILTVAGDGSVTLSGPLPDGAAVYRAEPAGLPADGDPAAGRAGAPGFGFARVLTGADGARMVPHFLAVDVTSDNRLLPQSSWTSEHRFALDAGCDAPTVRAALVHRAYPMDLAAERGWALTESVMAESQIEAEVTR